MARIKDEELEAFFKRLEKILIRHHEQMTWLNHEFYMLYRDILRIREEIGLSKGRI